MAILDDVKNWISYEVTSHRVHDLQPEDINTNSKISDYINSASAEEVLYTALSTYELQTDNESPPGFESFTVQDLANYLQTQLKAAGKS